MYNDMALGAATLRTLMELDNDTFDQIDGKLVLWLDPVSGFDQRAEILRAAVSIAIEHEPPPPENVVAVLVSAWLRTQNLPDEHRLEVVNLGSSLVTALLSVLEHPHPHAQRSVRKWAVEAIRAIDRTNATAMNIVMQRAETWCRNLTLNDELLLSSGDDKQHQRRTDGFIKRMGNTTPGKYRVLGRDFLLSEQEDHLFHALIPELLAGYPLAPALPIFESMAILHRLNDGIHGWDDLDWLVLLNQVDYLETAASLKKSAWAMRAQSVEAGINTAIPSNCATLLLGLTGNQDDEIAAEEMYVSIEGYWTTYENDYLPDPNKSFWMLERRHAQAFLVDSKIAIRRRIQRSKDFLIDPTFEMPESFSKALVDEAQNCDASNLSRSLQTTSEDYDFRELQIGLARCAHGTLAGTVRAKIQSFRTRTTEARYVSALNSRKYLILIGHAEQEVAKILRMIPPSKDEKYEIFIRTAFLLLELVANTAIDQAKLYLNANLPHVAPSASYLLRPLSADEADLLLDQYANGSNGEVMILLSLFNAAGFQPSGRVWNWMLKIALNSEPPMRNLAFMNLTIISAERFGCALLEHGWRWDASLGEFTNHYGSKALIAAISHRPLTEVLGRIAPAKLLKAVRIRGANPIEVLIVANLLTNIFHATETIDIDLSSILTIDQSKVCAGSFEMSSDNLYIPPEDDSKKHEIISALIRGMQSADAYNAAMRLAESRIRQAREAGAKVLMEEVSVEDLMLVVAHAPTVLDQWLDGMEQNTRAFRHRVHFSHSIFYSLCEAMLVRDMPRGITFWHRLYDRERTGGMRITGRLGIRELIHMPFKMPDTENAQQLRAELLDLRNCNTDLDLFNLVLCANLHHKQQWLASIITADEASPLPWQQKRAMVLKGFAVGNCLPVANAWPEAELRTSYDRLAHQAAQWQTREACARHWWRTFLGCETVEAAYAAWILLLETTDRRTWIWFDDDIRKLKSNSPHFELKTQHVYVNMDALEKAMTENEKDMKEKFLNLKIGTNVFPWRREATFD